MKTAFALLVAALVPSVTAAEQAADGWQVRRSQSLIDDSVAVVAVRPALTGLGNDPNMFLFLQCTRSGLAVGVGTDRGWATGGKSTLKVEFRIDAGKPDWSLWAAGADRTTLSVLDSPERFVASLPSNGRLALRVTSADDRSHEAAFDLMGIESVRSQVGSCK